MKKNSLKSFLIIVFLFVLVIANCGAQDITTKPVDITKVVTIDSRQPLSISIAPPAKRPVNETVYTIAKPAVYSDSLEEGEELMLLTDEWVKLHPFLFMDSTMARRFSHSYGGFIIPTTIRSDYDNPEEIVGEIFRIQLLSEYKFLPKNYTSLKLNTKTYTVSVLSYPTEGLAKEAAKCILGYHGETRIMRCMRTDNPFHQINN